MAGYLYILSNFTNTTLYIGSSTDLIRRIYEHKNHLIEGSFTDKYNITKLVYYEPFESIQEARHREYQIKHWNRKKKEFLINKENPNWKDLYFNLI